MPRTVAYILLTKSGPTRDAQLEAIRAAGLPVTPAYVDDLSKRRAMEKREFPERALLLRQLRPGDTVAVASPGRLGIGKEDVLAMLQAVQAKSAAVIDASTGLTLRWEPEMAAAWAFVDRAVTEHKAAAAAAARKAKAAQGVKGGAKPKPFLIPEAEVKRRWLNQADYPSQQEVADAAGKTARTLYSLFGPRGGMRNAKRQMK